MKKLIAIILLLPLIKIEAQLFPTLGGQRAGISTAQFLKIGVGGRAAAMGDAFISIADDASSLYWNPAGMAYMNRNEIMFSHNEWVADIKHEFLGAAYRLSANDVVGVSFISLHMDDMPVTTEVMPFGTGEYFSVGDIAISVSYSRKMTEQFSFGGTIRYIEETLDKLKMRGIMIDLGTLYWTGLGSSRFAVAITNFGNELAPDGDVILFGGRKKSDWQSFSPPTMFRIGFAFEPIQNNNHRLTASAQLNHPNDNSENVSFGFEYSWNSLAFLRGGYKLNVDEQDFTFGAGFRVPLSIADVTVDYAYSGFERLGSAHRFSILLGLY
ncbi:MAG: PorV/PorQ family protein [Melioribacteraceae bacterium]|nr:PorV/PorQ family protein [Melioribacteraceae bacterium]